jgi:apolipoprotein D and lipocalin family protein
MIRFIVSVFVFAAVLSQTKPEDKAGRPLAVVPSVDFVRYSGTWYEIARLPNKYQSECAGDVTATYTVCEDGSVQVVNRCRTASGDTITAEGKARRKSDDEPNSKLEVRFAPAILSFLPFVWGNYWIIRLAEDYSYVVVGEPDRKYLWILSRTQKMDETRFGEILSGIREQGYDVSGLIRTKQGIQ